jgi:transposase
MEATIFTGWVYDFLKPYAVALKVAHPEMLKAISAAKKKNDRADAEKIADLLRLNLLPECYMLSEEIRELRRILRYRNHIVRTAVKMQNKISGLLMEVGVSYSKRRIHGRKYFHEILERVEEIPPYVKELLKLSRSGYEMFRTFQKKLVGTLHANNLIHDRVRRLMTIPGVGEITALNWEWRSAMRIGLHLFARQSVTAACAAHNGNRPARNNGDRFSRNGTSTCKPCSSRPPSWRHTGTSNWPLCMSGS